MTSKNQLLSKTALAGCLALSMLGFGVALPAVAHADARFTSEDKFIAGSLQANQETSLNITKYKQPDAGVASTGSTNDAKKISANSTPVQGVEFTVFPIKLNNTCQPADLKITNGETVAGTQTEPTVTCGTVSPDIKRNTTDGNGRLIFNLGSNQAVKYYVLQETNKLPGIAVSQPTIISLPFYTADENGNVGYVYNLSVFPKNLTTNQLNKSVVGPSVVQVGNKLKYTLSESIFDANNGIKPNGNDSYAAQAGDGFLDISEITSSAAQPQIRIVDRLSSDLKLEGTPKVFWTCGENKGDIASGDYTFNNNNSDPKRISANSNDLIFKDGHTGKDVKYLTWDFWKDAQAAERFKSEVATCTAPVRLNIEFDATVTGLGDGAAGAPGFVHNIANVDVYDGSSNSAGNESVVDVRSSSPGFNFAKSDASGKNALQGAVFRLSDPKDPTKFLCTDGTFKTDGDFITATSNNKGIVTFSGLPFFTQASYTDDNGKLVIDPNTTVNAEWMTGEKAGLLDIVEVTAPDGYQVPNVHFGDADHLVTFADYAGKTAQQLAALGSLKPRFDPNAFGQSYNIAESDISNFKDSNSEKVEHGLKNFKPAEAPIGLPLTGSKGILIFLILGVSVVGITLFVRYRIGKAQSTKR